MKQKYLKKEGNGKLLLLFSGWGGAPELFSCYDVEAGHDCLLCYDYKDLSFDRALLDGYDSVRVAAWSMGVWAADSVCRSLAGVRWDGAVAFGGTRFPIDDRMGIPESIFDGTLNNMSVPVLHKFRRRMCGKELEHFMAHIPERSIEDLKTELSAIRSMVMDGGMRRTGQFFWTMAVAGNGDLIFPFANQCNAWREDGVPVVEADASHYDSAVFAVLLGGGEFER